MTENYSNLIQAAKPLLIKGHNVEYIANEFGISCTLAKSITHASLGEIKYDQKVFNMYIINDITKMENEAYNIALEIAEGNVSWDKRNRLNLLLMKLETANYIK